MEEIIKAKSGTYGRVQVTLLMPVKKEILDWAKHFGINKAAFLRISLMIGSSQLVKMILAEKATDYIKNELSGQPDART